MKIRLWLLFHLLVSCAVQAQTVVVDNLDPHPTPRPTRLHSQLGSTTVR